MALRLFSRQQKSQSQQASDPFASNAGVQDGYEPSKLSPLSDDPLERCIQQQRYGYLFSQHHPFQSHPAIKRTCAAAAKAIDAQFAIVPEGIVSLAQTTVDTPGAAESDIETDPFLMSCTCVTNAQYQMFVDSDGYGDLSLWPKDIWSHLIDFKDQTGLPAPRFWRDARHDGRLASHPVVGICYYEAAAYARWAGYRIPTGAEWQMAASWRIRSAAHVMRRYPWGDALDTRRCNLWASGVGHTIPVDKYESGGAPNGVLQLIGNVWEWTESDYAVTDEEGGTVVGDMLLKEVRGGAFDTYFSSQATSHFRTGLNVLSRVHNVGFRCALDPASSANRSGGK